MPTWRYRDALGRVTTISGKDAACEQYLRPSDGRLTRLVVQNNGARAFAYKVQDYQRTWLIPYGVSPILDLVHWTYSSVLIEGSDEQHYDVVSVICMILKWLPSCILLALMLIVPQNLEGGFRNEGCYDPIRYRDWGYAKTSRNRAEDRNPELNEGQELQDNAPLLAEDLEMSVLTHHLPSRNISTSEIEELDDDDDYDDLPARHFRPRFLCFLNGDGYETCKVTDWVRQQGDNANPSFVFLSYTRKQFCVATEQEIDKWDLPQPEDKAFYRQFARRDRQTLVQYGIRAARSAGALAFWLDFECLRDADNQARARSQTMDVYRICDVVRAAHSLVILLGPSLQSRKSLGEREVYSPEPPQLWLQEWGTRLWTLPEILLCSPEHPVKIYTIGGPGVPEELPKRSFAARGAWKDVQLVRQLVDHYDSSIHLTPLELVSISVECFANRQTDQFHNGDFAYALMGLLRRRPAINRSDSSFEAFARLSLANDSDMLLERLLCMQPVRPDARWHEFRDAWGARLWDIEPRCQVAGIVDDETVTLDGAVGSTIQWDRMDQVAFLKRPTVGRKVGKVLLRGLPGYLIIGLAFTITGVCVQLQESTNSTDSTSSSYGDYSYYDQSQPDDGGNGISSSALGLLIPGLIFLVPSLIIALAAPAMLFDIYRGKFWSTQALFVGVEGLVDIGKAERYLFGFNHGRLKWSTNGSTLSRHKYVNGECVPAPPATGTAPKGHILYTLIDTYALTATAFYAKKPPVAVIVCGQEGGMQRAVLCSYDWRTQTFARETVLRVKTLVLDRLLRVDRFRFAFKRRQYG